MDFWLSISVSIPFAIWVALDSRKRLMNPAPWALSALFVLPIALPVYAARRHLFGGEGRKGGFAWNCLKYFAILWTVAMAIVAREVLSGEPAIAEEDVWTRAGAFAASGVLGALWFVFAISRRGSVLLNVLIGTLLVLSAASGAPLDLGEKTEALAAVFLMWLLPVALALTAGLIFRRSGAIERGPTGPLAVGPIPSSAEEPHVVSSPHAASPENKHQRQEALEVAVGGIPEDTLQPLIELEKTSEETGAAKRPLQEPCRIKIWRSRAWIVAIAAVALGIILWRIQGVRTDQTSHRIEVVSEAPNGATSILTLPPDQVIRELQKPKGLKGLVTPLRPPFGEEAWWRRSGRTVQPSATVRSTLREAFGEILWKARALHCDGHDVSTRIRVELVFLDRDGFTLWKRAEDILCEEQLAGRVLLPESLIHQVAQVRLYAKRP